jgi:WD40 repeat protein
MKRFVLIAALALSAAAVYAQRGLAVEEAAAVEVFPQLGHGRQVTSAVFSADGRYVFSVSWDGTVKMWESATGQELRNLANNNFQMYCAALSPNGKLLNNRQWADRYI